MQFAFCNEAYVNWPFERVCGDLAACGYGGVEIAPFTLDEDPRRIDERRAAEVGEIARRAGIEVVGLHWLLAKPDGFHLTAPDDALRKRTVEFLRHLARLCAAMGGRVMVFGSPKQRSILPGEKAEDVFRRAADAFRAVCEVAGPLGVTLAVEPLAPAETDFLNTAAETVRLIEAVDHPACRLHLDVKAMSSEPGPIDRIILDNRRDLAHFHANDPNRRGPGTGTVDFAPIAQALKTIGYDGCVSVEVFDYTPDGPTIARTSLEYLKRMFDLA
ncbi:MAG: sugar phosphate isomerase/epimerase [Pirellulales bacterium]|nr:sugar phosphate isomerase/epimerase [Pirellulales bacterium]